VTIFLRPGDCRDPNVNDCGLFRHSGWEALRHSDETNIGKYLDFRLSQLRLSACILSTAAVLPGPPMKSGAYQIQFRVTAPETPPFVAHCHTSAACKLTLDVRSDHGLSFSIVHSAVLSLETDELRCVPASSHGPSTVVDAAETVTPR